MNFTFWFLHINAINLIHFAHPASPHPHSSVLTRELQIELALCENLCLQKDFIRKHSFSMICFESTERFPRAGFILRCIFIQEISLFPILHPLLLPFHSRTEHTTSHTSFQGPVLSTVSKLDPVQMMYRYTYPPEQVLLMLCICFL